MHLMRRYEITTSPSSLSHEVESASQHKNWKGFTLYKLTLAAAFYTMFGEKEIVEFFRTLRRMWIMLLGWSNQRP